MDNQAPQQPQAPIAPESPLQQPVDLAKKPPVLGFVGLGLAVVGIVLSCIPAILIIGVLVLITAFIISLVAINKKNTVKWPSLVGLILSGVAGIAGIFLFTVALTVALNNRAHEATTTDSSSSVVEE